jgi:hypothetical protein
VLAASPTPPRCTARHGAGSRAEPPTTGLTQPVGIGDRTSSILKSPLGSRGTPAAFVLCSVNGAAGSQISVAKTSGLPSC